MKVYHTSIFALLYKTYSQQFNRVMIRPNAVLKANEIVVKTTNRGLASVHPVHIDNLVALDEQTHTV